MHLTFVLPGTGHHGGIRVTVEIANRLLSRGHQVRIVYPAQPRFKLKALVGALKSARLRLQGVTKTDWINGFRGRTETFSSLSQVGFLQGEVVIAVGTKAVSYVRTLDSRVLKLRYCHGLRPDDSQLEQEAFGFPMPTITVASTQVQRLKALTGQSHIEVIPNAINPEEYFIEKSKREAIGAICAEGSVKGCDILCDVYRQSVARFPDIPWVGFGAVSKPPSLASIMYTRYPSVDMARKIYNSAKVWLITSRTEGFPAPILEAMACGCALISTDTDGGRELIRHGENGFLVSTNDTTKFVEYVNLLVRNEALRAEIVKAGLRTVSLYSWESTVQQLESYLTSILEKT